MFAQYYLATRVSADGSLVSHSPDAPPAFGDNHRPGASPLEVYGIRGRDAPIIEDLQYPASMPSLASLSSS